MIKRNSKGQFIKGILSTPKPFKKGHIPWNKNKKLGFIPKCAFQKGHIPWHSGEKLPQLSGKNHWHWKGGKYQVNSGRWFIWKPEHPFAGSRKYIRQSRLVAEKCLGRYLIPKEVIHHINGDKSDDRPKNLYLFPSKSTHMGYESLKNKIILKSNLN